MIKNKFPYGLITGILLPILAYALLWAFDYSLITSNKDLVTGNSQLMWTGFKPSTLVLMALCTNLIPTYFANKRRMDEYIRGIMIPTVIYSFIWFFYFRDTFTM